MKKYLAILLVSICMPSLASDYFGVYEQIPPKFESENKELVKRALAKFEENKFTLHIDEQYLRVSMWDEDYIKMPYEEYGKTIVAKTDDGMYWVLYIESSDLIHSTATKFGRVSGLEP